jgi:superfamily I DNA and/or RNA helicase
LNEHFRCASEIIAFSNEHFYDNQLIPLRLPTQSERISPSIVDVRLPKGVKVGKINQLEADEIVQRVTAIVESYDRSAQKQRRSIGVISLMGDEQSRLIRGRLLDTIGPQRMAQHSILVGDPPSFQGTERDSTFTRHGSNDSFRVSSN